MKYLSYYFHYITLIISLLCISNIKISGEEYTITFHHYYKSDITINVNSGEKIGKELIPISSSCDEAYPYFVGWTENTILTESTIKPTIIDGNTEIDRDLELYPVFCTHENQISNWFLVTNISELNIKDRIVLAASDANYTLGTTQNINNRSRAKITKNTENSTIIFNDDTQIIVLEEGTQENTFAFNTNKGYLYAASNSSNYLRTQTDLSDNSSWAITIDDNFVARIVAQGNNSHKLIRYNNAEIFSCYKSSGRGNIHIYKEISNSTTSQYTICIQKATATFYTGEKGTQIFNNIIIGTNISEIEGIPTNLTSYDDECQTFVGWTNNPHFNNTQQPEIVTTITQDIELYPVFSNQHGLLISADTPPLNEGDKIVIAAKNHNYAMSVNENNIGTERLQTEIVKKNNKIAINDLVQIITLEKGINDNTFALNVGNGYLFNYEDQLKTVSTITKRSSWQISIENDTECFIQNSSTNNFIGYNNTDGIFICHSNKYVTGRATCIYKIIDATRWITNITIESGTTYSIENNQEINLLTIKSTLDKSANINLQNCIIDANRVIFEKTIDESKYFFFTLPFDCKIADITATNEDGEVLKYATDALTGDYVINYYDQALAAKNAGNEGKKAWVEMLELNSVLQANRGYIVGHFNEGLVKIAFRGSEKVKIEKKNSMVIDLGENYEWYTEGERMESNGWNLIGMPTYGDAPVEKMSCGNSEIKYVTIEKEDGKCYDQMLWKEAKIEAFKSFFIQTGVNMAPTVVLNTTNTEAVMAMQKRRSESAVVRLQDENGGGDRTTIIDDHTATDDYVIGKDLSKWIGYGDIPQIYSTKKGNMMAYNYTNITNNGMVDIGMYAPNNGEYKVSLEAESDEWILIDKQNDKEIKAGEWMSVELKDGENKGRFGLIKVGGETTGWAVCDKKNSVWITDRRMRIEDVAIGSRIEIYDMMGRKIYGEVVNENYWKYDFKMNGMYVVVVVENGVKSAIKCLIY